MASTEAAERLVGFKSGTMAPICHTIPMKLYPEETIVAKIKKNSKETSTTNNTMLTNITNNNIIDVTKQSQQHRLNVGSGMFGKCLSIPIDKFLKIAGLTSTLALTSTSTSTSLENNNQNTTGGIEICSLIRKKKTKQR
jgi:hypothetical protein